MKGTLFSRKIKGFLSWFRNFSTFGICWISTTQNLVLAKKNGNARNMFLSGGSCAKQRGTAGVCRRRRRWSRHYGGGGTASELWDVGVLGKILPSRRFKKLKIFWMCSFIETWLFWLIHFFLGSAGNLGITGLILSCWLFRVGRCTLYRAARWATGVQD